MKYQEPVTKLLKKKTSEPNEFVSALSGLSYVSLYTVELSTLLIIELTAESLTVLVWFNVDAEASKGWLSNNNDLLNTDSI